MGPVQFTLKQQKNIGVEGAIEEELAQKNYLLTRKVWDLFQGLPKIWL